MTRIHTELYSRNRSMSLQLAQELEHEAHAAARAQRALLLLPQLALRGGESTTENALTLGQIQARLGHTGRHIDLLKVDCEGCEWDALTRVFGDLRAGNLTVGQIQVELHAPVSITKSEERGDRAQVDQIHRRQSDRKFSYSVRRSGMLRPVIRLFFGE